MADLPNEGAPRGVAGTSAALLAVGAVAGIGVVLSAIGLLTLDGNETAAALYAGGMGGGVISLLLIGIAAGARQAAAEDELLGQVEMRVDRIESVAGSLSREHVWQPEELRAELEEAEQAYWLAQRIGAVDHARRVSRAITFVKARTGVGTRSSASAARGRRGRTHRPET